MKVLFTTKMHEDRNYQPLGVYHLSAMLKHQGHETCLVDALSIDRVERAVEKVRPDVLAVSTPTTRYPFFRRLCSGIKRKFPSLFLVVGGTHTTLVPESIADEGIDAICRGEGDYALAELVNRLARGEDYGDTPGFWIKTDGGIRKNPVADLIANLDALPFGDRAIPYLLGANRISAIAPFVAGRGCPFQCTFCCNGPIKELYKGSYSRWYSPARIVEEVAFWSRRFRYGRIAFMNEIFGAGKSWLTEFAELYPKRVGIGFWCMMHPSLLDRERAQLLAQSGCVTVLLGIESGSERIRKDVLNRNVSQEQILQAAQNLREVDIKVHATNILEIPGADLENEIETVDLNRKARVDFPDVCIYQPYPLAPLTQKAIEEGSFDGDFEKISATLNPSINRRFLVRSDESRRVEKLGYLFPFAVKSSWVRRFLPLLITLPLRTVYHLAFKMIIAWFKLRYMVGLSQVLNTQFPRVLWTFFRT